MTGMNPMPPREEMYSSPGNPGGDPNGGFATVTPGDPDSRKRNLLATGGVLGALAASSCCVAPLVLFSVGISGAWIGNLTALYPYKAYFITFALLFLGGGFYHVYRKPTLECVEGSYCASPTSDRVLKTALWASLILTVAAIVFPYAAPYFLEY